MFVTLNRSQLTTKDKELSSFGRISSIFLVSFLGVRNSLSKAIFCWVFFLEFSFSWWSINCSTEFMSANLEAMILGKQGMLQTFTLNYFAWPPPKARKPDSNFRTLSYDTFTSEKKKHCQWDCFLSKRDYFYFVSLLWANLSTDIIKYVAYKYVTSIALSLAFNFFFNALYPTCFFARSLITHLDGSCDAPLI